MSKCLLKSLCHFECHVPLSNKKEVVEDEFLNPPTAVVKFVKQTRSFELGRDQKVCFLVPQTEVEMFEPPT